MNTTFANYSDLMRKARNKKIFIELSNGYYIPVQKNRLKMVADSMVKNDDKFCGDALEFSASILKVSLVK